MSPDPSFFASLDPQRLAWSGGWALVSSLVVISTRRRAVGEVPAPWWALLGGTVLGGLMGGVGTALLLPEWFPAWNSPGRLSALSIGGATLGPWLAIWIRQAFVQAVAFYSKYKLGVEIKLRDQEGPHDEQHPS